MFVIIKYIHQGLAEETHIKAGVLVIKHFPFSLRMWPNRLGRLYLVRLTGLA
jgi:hypothetical protein